jgi:hypothetical protein
MQDSMVFTPFIEAVRKYGMEGIEWYRSYMETQVGLGAEPPPVAPLF